MGQLALQVLLAKSKVTPSVFSELYAIAYFLTLFKLLPISPSLLDYSQ